MNTHIIFDNGGLTLDRFTIINSETGDVFGASENPSGPKGIGKWIGNCAAHRTVLNRCGWRQRLPSKKVVKSETENYINNARLDPDWIGREIDFKALPERVIEFISGLDHDTSGYRQRMANIIFLKSDSKISREPIEASQVR